MAAADTTRIAFASIAPQSSELEELFAAIDDVDVDKDEADEDEASSIDSLFGAVESEELFTVDTSGSLVTSALEELLNDDELFSLEELAADIVTIYDKE